MGVTSRGRRTRKPQVRTTSITRTTLHACFLYSVGVSSGDAGINNKGNEAKGLEKGNALSSMPPITCVLLDHLGAVVFFLVVRLHAGATYNSVSDREQKK